MTRESTVTRDREYETIFILRSEITKESSETISTRIMDVVGREGGKLTRIESWGRRRLPTRSASRSAACTCT